MNRSLMMMLGAIVVAYVPAATLQGQSALERLETQIRQRVAISGRETTGGGGPAAAERAAPRHAGKLGYLGLMADDGKDRGRGVRILDVQPGGPAAKAGLRGHDLITAIAAVRVRQISDMSEVLSAFGPGQTVDFDILRDERPQKLHVVLGDRALAVERRAEVPGGDGPETVPLPAAEATAEPPEAQIAEPTLAPPKGAEPVISTTARLDQLERRLDGLERRISELEKAFKKRNKE